MGVKLVGHLGQPACPVSSSRPLGSINNTLLIRRLGTKVLGACRGCDQVEHQQHQQLAPVTVGPSANGSSAFNTDILGTGGFRLTNSRSSVIDVALVPRVGGVGLSSGPPSGMFVVRTSFRYVWKVETLATDVLFVSRLASVILVTAVVTSLA